MNVLEARRRLLGADVKKKTAEGNPISVRSLARMHPGLSVMGKSTQRTTTGAQLFDIRKATVWGGIYGLTMSIDGEIIKISGVLSHEASTYRFRILNYPENLYGNKISMDIIDDTGVENESVYAMQSENSLAVYFDSTNGTEVNLVFRLMVNSGDTALPWEPYTGGQPSPSPDYPQEISSVGDDGSIQVNVTGANLFDASLLNGVSDNGITAKNVNGMIQVTGIALTDFGVNLYSSEFFLNAGEYSISLSNSVDFWISFIPVGTYIAALDCKPGDVFAHGLIDSGQYRIRIYKECKANEDVNFEVYIVASFGSVFYPYEPYKQPQTLTIQTPNGLPGIPVDSGGNYTDADGQQWVCDEIDCKRGKYVKRVGSVLADGTVNKFTASADNAFWNFSTNHSAPGVISGRLYFSIYFARDFFGANEPGEFIYVVSEKGQKYFNTVDDLNTFCVEKNTEGNPLIIYYPMYPIETNLTLEQMEAYASQHTNYPTTIVTATDDAGLKLTYKTKKSLGVTD